MVRSQLLGQAGGFFCRQSSHRPQVRELWEVGRDIIQRRHSVSPPGRNFLSVYHKKSRCNNRARQKKGNSSLARKKDSLMVAHVIALGERIWQGMLPFFVLADINQTLTNFANILIAFVGGATIIMLVTGGYLFMTSEGNPRRREYAFGALAGAAIGAMIVILAPELASAFVKAVAK